MKKYFLLMIFIFSFLFLAPLYAESKQVVGWIEKVRIYPGNLIVHAKLDTGADNCSINVPNVEFFERRGEKWVRFDFTNREGKTVTFERKVVRIVKIKRKGAKRQERPVIMLGVCLGNVYKEFEVNLANRSGFKYHMLIGRKFLKGDFLIDSSIKYTVEPGCKEVREK